MDGGFHGLGDDVECICNLPVSDVPLRGGDKPDVSGTNDAGTDCVCHDVLGGRREVGGVVGVISEVRVGRRGPRIGPEVGVWNVAVERVLRCCCLVAMWKRLSALSSQAVVVLVVFFLGGSPLAVVPHGTGESLCVGKIYNCVLQPLGVLHKQLLQVQLSPRAAKKVREIIAPLVVHRQRSTPVVAAVVTPAATPVSGSAAACSLSVLLIFVLVYCYCRCCFHVVLVVAVPRNQPVISNTGRPPDRQRVRYRCRMPTAAVAVRQVVQVRVR